MGNSRQKYFSLKLISKQYFLVLVSDLKL